MCRLGARVNSSELSDKSDFLSCPDQSRNDSCVITLTLPTKPANARASLEIRGEAAPNESGANANTLTH